MNQWVAGRIIYPAVVRAIGEGSLFSRLRSLQSIQWWPAERVADLQRERLADLLNHAARRTVHYREVLSRRIPVEVPAAPEALRSLPFLTKTDVQDRASEMAAVPRPGRVTHKTTGGSTGQAVTILKDRSALAFERAAMWLGYGWAGVRFGDRCARFWGSQFDGRRRLLGSAGDFAMNRVRFSAFAFDDADLERYWRRCIKFRPAYLYGYVSMLEAFAEFVTRRGYDGRALGAAAIITTSEVLSPPQRELLQRVFGCTVSVEYGCGEVGPIAYECERGSLHTMSADLIVEVLDDRGEPVAPGSGGGHIVLTDLNGRAMPLIRYRIGDNGVPGSKCSCGRGFGVLSAIWGREYDVVQGLDGRRFHGEFFMYLFEDLRRMGRDIRAFQVVQETRDRLRILVVADPETIEGSRPVIEARLAGTLPGMTVAVEPRAAIERAASGKMQVVRNLALSRRTGPGPARSG